jgi:hypothetical protein
MKTHVSLHLLFAVSVTIVSSVALAQSEKAKAFAEADKYEKGCETIPYENLRSQCEDQAKEVHPWCDGERGPIKCEAVTREITDGIMRNSKAIEQLKDKRRELEDSRVHATENENKNKYQEQIEAVDKEIEATERSMQDQMRSLDERKNAVRKTIDNIQKCIDYRKSTMAIFAYSLDKTRNENDPDIKELASSLTDKAEKQKSGHMIAIRDKENAIEACNKGQ